MGYLEKFYDIYIDGADFDSKPVVCEKWDLSNKAHPITALGEPYYDCNFFCSENNMQDILNLLNDILENA